MTAERRGKAERICALLFLLHVADSPLLARADRRRLAEAVAESIVLELLDP